MRDTMSFAPQHMDRYSRNERLYQFLLSMGLVVSPICSDDDPTKIESLWVSTVLPAAAAEVSDTTEDAAKASVRKVMERTQVGDVVGAAETIRDGVVIEFPSPLG
jgi:hypothetical protein